MSPKCNTMSNSFSVKLKIREISITLESNLWARFYHFASDQEIIVNCGTSLAVQWLRLRASTAGCAGLILVWELRSCMPQSADKK